MGANPLERIWHNCERSDPPELLLAVCTPTLFTHLVVDCTLTHHNNLRTECSIAYPIGRLPIFHIIPSNCMPSHICGMSASHPG